MKNKFYITTPIYYVNAKPHIGHAYTTIAADVLARFHKIQKDEVFFLTGTDEHGMKIQKEAEKAGKEPQIFVDEISGEFENLWKKLDIQYDNFIRTTDEKHKKAVQKVLKTLFDKGAIYKGEYEGLYCTGCEQFLNESDLVDGKCPDHGTQPEKMKEESYLLKMTELQEKLISAIEKDDFQIRPEKYKNEILSFLKKQELKDLSISRKNVSWGIPLPFDESHTAYVWVDALLNYLTGIGFDGENIPENWPANVQLIGKDILRVHATIWPVLLMYLGISFPKMLFVHGHILSGGKKMSKTLGNTISIEEMVEKFGIEGTRYLLLSAGIFGNDIDVTMDRLIEKYNSDLANGLGNLTSRVVKLSEKIDKKFETFNNLEEVLGENEYSFMKEKEDWVPGCRFDFLLDVVTAQVGILNKEIEDNKPWDLAKNNPEEFEKFMLKIGNALSAFPILLEPFMPETAEKIKEALEEKKTSILFGRIK